ncbi:MAG: phosphate ABC transporter ATP-binding protein [Nitrospirae bacterium]|jgi:tungstate transport system ATP-binding protein|nr:phosphate ABC transporter ATP-binding protein [Nitrospirota bacterium]
MSLRFTADNVCKSYNGKSVLKECSFSFDRGCVYILMGPNGSGKSTFLRICALLEDPDSGEVKYYSDTTALNPSLPGVGLKGGLKKDIKLRRKITLVLPKIGLFNTTVFDNVAYGLKIRVYKKRDIEVKVNEVLEFVGLAHKKKLNALTLSSGETQRLGIARAIVLKPEVLFLDEPTASLDPQSTEMIEEMISRLKGRDRMTIIMVSHNIFQAQRLADMVLFMYDGRIVDYGTKKEFFERPKDERAYRFITGQMVY